MQTIYYGLGAVGIICGGIWAVVKGAFWLGDKFAGIETQLDVITNNHLSHIYEELKYLREKVG